MNKFVYTMNHNMGNYAIPSHYLSLERNKEKSKDIGDNIWTMYFRGAQSQLENNYGIVLITLQRETLDFSNRLEFEATNNGTEYEAQLFGLGLAKEMGAKFLEVITNSKLIIFQVKDKYSTENEKLK